ncbi:MAG: metallophosphoesterase [Clostridia bacterium]|nr:metallophosphoesterase [Clostridia bacterium]
MKKTVSVFVSVLFLLSALILPARAEKKDCVFAAASDLHYNQSRQALAGEIDDPIYWYANRRAAMEDESGFIIDEFLRQCADDDSVEFVLIAGDMADNGRSIVEEHLDVAEKFRCFERKTGKQIYVIDGNHDMGDDSACDTAKFKEIYAEFGYDEALTVDDATCSYTADLNETYRLIALDSCDPSKSTEDGLTLSRVNWALAQAKQAYADGKYPILMMHHNLLDHLPVQRVLSHDFIVRNHLTTAARFADAGIRTVITGHEHCSDAAGYISPLGNRIYDFAVTSLTMYPLQYRCFSLTDGEIAYEAKTVLKIDTDALSKAVAGYSEEQLALMNEDMNAYAKGFLKKGVEYRLSLSLTPEKLGIDENAFYAAPVLKLVDKLTGILDAPYYGEDSVSSLAEKYGIALPATQYETPWDLATELVSWHYAGEEHFEPDSDEVTLLLLTVALIARAEFARDDVPTLLAAADALNADGGADALIAQAKKLLGGVSPAEYLAVAALSPLLYEFAYDADGVNDNNGTIPGYAESGSAQRAANLSEAFAALFARIAKNLSLILSVLSNIGKF